MGIISAIITLGYQYNILGMEYPLRYVDGIGIMKQNYDISYTSEKTGVPSAILHIYSNAGKYALINGVTPEIASQIKNFAQIYALNIGIRPRDALRITGDVYIESVKRGVTCEEAIQFKTHSQTWAYSKLLNVTKALEFQTPCQALALYSGANETGALNYTKITQIVALKNGVPSEDSLKILDHCQLTLYFESPDADLATLYNCTQLLEAELTPEKHEYAKQLSLRDNDCTEQMELPDNWPIYHPDGSSEL